MKIVYYVVFYAKTKKYQIYCYIAVMNFHQCCKAAIYWTGSKMVSHKNNFIIVYHEKYTKNIFISTECFCLNTTFWQVHISTVTRMKNSRYMSNVLVKAFKNIFYPLVLKVVPSMCHPVVNWFSTLWRLKNMALMLFWKPCHKNMTNQ